MPFVLLDRYLPGIDCSYAVADNRQGACLATEYLLNTVGEHITMIHFPLCNSTVIDRFGGFRAAYIANGHMFSNANACLINDLALLNKSNQERIEYIVSAILNHLKKYNHTRGIFAANAEIAQIAYYAVGQMGFSPGENFQIVSFDNSYLPGIHFIQQNFHMMVNAGMDLLNAQISGDFTVTHSCIPTSFIHVEVHPTLSGSLRYLVKEINP